MEQSGQLDVSVVAGDGGRNGRAKQVAKDYGLRFAAEADAETRFILEVTALRIQLRDNARPKHKPLWVDLNSARVKRRLRVGDRLLRAACRVRGQDHPELLDATAGMGEDALVLASMGFVITAIERSPVVAAGFCRKSLR